MIAPDSVIIAPFDDHSKYISGTSVSAIMGVNPYMSAFQVWDRIVNGTQQGRGNEFSEKKKRAGLKLERAILEMYEEDTGRSVIHTPAAYGDVTFVSKEYPMFCGTPDACHIGDQLIVEVKNLGYKSAKGFEDGEVPYYYYTQAQWYCWLFGMQGVQYAYLIDGYDFRISEIYPRDNVLIGAMLEAGLKFWNDHIITKIPPVPTTAKDVVAMFPEAMKDSSIVATDDIRQACTFFRELKAQAKEIEKNIQEVEDTISAYMGIKEFISDGGAVLATYKTTHQIRFNDKALKEYDASLHERFKKDTSFRTLRVR